MKFLIVLGEGGHTKEMIQLADQLGPDHQYSYLLVQGDDLSKGKITRQGPIHWARRPRDKTHNFILDSYKTIQCGWHAWRALRKEQPDAILSCGPSVGAPACLVAKLMGVKVIFVETGSRVTALSMTGKIVYRFADLFIVQWPQLAKNHSQAVFGGRFW
ncbi:MAG: PssD/Cps14F family polysaccharide biosynthesis glycosyltransferase [bacterium]